MRRGREALLLMIILVACRTPQSAAPTPRAAGFPDIQWAGFFTYTLDARYVQTAQRPHLHVCDTLAERLVRIPMIATRIRALVDSVTYGVGADCPRPARTARTMLVLKELHYDSTSAWAELYGDAGGGTWYEVWRAGTRGPRFFLPWTITMTIISRE